MEKPYERLHPRLKRGIAWCTKCGKSKKINLAIALNFKWPRCCGKAMTIDSPEERE